MKVAVVKKRGINSNKRHVTKRKDAFRIYIAKDMKLNEFHDKSRENYSQYSLYFDELCKVQNNIEEIIVNEKKISLFDELKNILKFSWKAIFS